MIESPEDIGQRLKAALDSRDIKSVKQWLRRNDPADVSEVLAAAELEDCLPLVRLVPRSRRAAVFSYLPFDRQEELLEELPELIVTPLVNDMEPDDRTRLLEELPFEIRTKILLKLTPEERKIAWQLLSYPDDSVGRLMTPDFMALSPTMKASQVLDMLRWSRRLTDEQLTNLFVIDGEGRYVGELSLVSLVTADPPSKLVGDLMARKQVSLKATDDQSVAVDFFRKYDRTFIPVVDDADRLLGLVTADDVFDVAEEEATEDTQQFGGQSPLEDSYFQTPLLTLFRKRAGWLALLFAGGTITAASLRHFEAYTVPMPWLVFFLPLIVSSGGNTGSQAASLVIRGIAVREMETRDWFKVLWREILVGVGLGCVLGAMGFARALGWDLDMTVGAVVAVSLVGVIAFGAVTGAMLPFIFKRLNLDPAVSSSPLLAQLVDIIGVVVFYNVARLLLGYWHALPQGLP
jgi:magnesium transporter